ncbi:MAG: hypothetical protein JOZ22_16590 [Acidobacteriia bacterium]|nr:hypothetical protein [Terriglobia bacterium]
MEQNLVGPEIQQGLYVYTDVGRGTALLELESHHWIAKLLKPSGEVLAVR